ncbi:MAG: glycosyltransferase family 4 protein [Magnetococcales bacterium]|nr:glycosyltransferase family 4 protein [Magnetococcales bacterium]MBF0148902.1 glycosyltransferase family 4 protein [Magnetococcales bacterium]
MTVPRSAVQKMAISWSIGHYHGWGVYGLNLVLAMLRRGVRPRLLQKPGAMDLDPLQARLMLQVLEDSTDYLRVRLLHPERMLRDADTIPLIHSDGRLVFDDVKFEGRPPIGITFFETARLDPKPIERAKQYARIIVGSRWNERILREKYGLSNVHFVMQGVETTQFYPSGRRGLLNGRFVVFSGGKLEFRKGQDLVVETFRRFHQRHPEALLLTSWSNRWVDASSRFPARWVEGFPEEGSEGLQRWMSRHLPPDSFFDVGLVANPRMPDVLREVDVALFPNRCEGGTNLVAMECMAMGIPVILSANTGHLDLVADDRCLILGQQQPVVSPVTGELMEDWGESSVDEALEALERVYHAPRESSRLGQEGHRFMRDHSWSHQCDQVIERMLE